jgi:hypothetical protein
MVALVIALATVVVMVVIDRIAVLLFRRYGDSARRLRRIVERRDAR